MNTLFFTLVSDIMDIALRSDTSRKRINWEILSITRFLLAMVVMIGHLSEFADIGFLKWYTYLGSFEAIFGFLLISGLSIGYSIKKNPDEYFKRRFKRIYPVYVSSIIFEIFVQRIDLTIYTVGMLLANFLFLNQVLTDTSFVGPSWTLSTEVWLYCLAPVFLKLNKKTLFLLGWFSFGCFVLYTCARTLLHWNYFSGTKYGINLVLLGFIWIAGFILAKYPDNKKNPLFIALLFAGHLGLAIGIQVLYRLKNHQQTAILTTDLHHFAGSFFCLVFVYYVVVFNHRVGQFRPPVKKLFNLLGDISYPLYLTHVTVFQLMKKLDISGAILFILGSLATSFLFYYFFDIYSKKRKIKSTDP